MGSEEIRLADAIIDNLLKFLFDTTCVKESCTLLLHAFLAIQVNSEGTVGKDEHWGRNILESSTFLHILAVKESGKTIILVFHLRDHFITLFQVLKQLVCCIVSFDTVYPAFRQLN